MKSVLILCMLVFSSVGLASGPNQLEVQLAERFGIAVMKGGSAGVTKRTESVGLFGWGGTKEVHGYYDSSPRSSEYNNFLAELINACERRGMKKSYIPFQVVVKKENWNLFDSNYFGADLKADRGVLEVGHMSWEALLDELQEYPALGTDEARELQLRDESIASLIVEKVNHLKAQGVLVNSHKYVNYFWRSARRDFESKDIYYFGKEDFLKGLINLELHIAAETENRVEIIITDKSYFKRESDEMHFDASGSHDERELEAQINARMAELQ